MLVTMDESGSVTNVEALTGPVAMRDLAVAAVRTWHYNPVIRGGHAVAAYTMALLSLGKYSSDLLKDPAVLDRLGALLEKFPPSEAQMLADLKQDSSVRSAGQDERNVGGGVEAFVPFLTPIGDFARPEWPDSFERDGIQGTVQMIVTIDGSGSVTNVEALTGPVAMRDLATAAVRTWHFNPVIRNDHPVAAYTTALLSHITSVGKHSFDDLKDPVARDREQALREKYARSDAEVLADVEQDSVGRTGRDRVEMLASLAKAAWLAGNANKAASYASELLTRREELLTSFRNGAIQDGNTVLGLVALGQGDTDKAKWYLLESARVTGTMLGMPRLALANALLQHGEKSTVLEYLNACHDHWLNSAEELERWIKAVSEGETPDFGVYSDLHA